MNRKLLKKFRERISGAIPVNQLIDIICMIDMYLHDQILNDKPVYINKFGTFSQVLNKPKMVWSRSQKKMVMTHPTKRLVFRVHATFQELIASKKKELLKVKKIKTGMI